METINRSFLPKNATSILIAGPVGKLECLVLTPTIDIIGVAIIFHPDPKGGGTNTNKVVQTIAKNLNTRGYLCYCPNLRGVGISDGIHDNGVGEVDDAVAIHDYLRRHYPETPLVLAGFSFGCAIASNLAMQVEHQRLILIGPAVTRYNIVVPDKNKIIVIHSDNDEIIPFADVIFWADQHNIAIVRYPHSGHFFHGQLSGLQQLLNLFTLS